MIDMKVGLEDWIATMKRLGAYPLQIRKALEYAQKEALSAMRSETTEKLTEKYYIAPAKVKQAINSHKYTKGGKFVVRGTRLKIHNYKLLPTKRPQKPKELKGAVKRGSGLKSLGRAFLMPTKTGKHIAMLRKGASQYPIKPVISPAIPQLLEHNQWIQRDIFFAGIQVMKAKFREKVSSFMVSGEYRGEVNAE